MNNPVWNDWVKKEFISTMRAKGKLPEPDVEAVERKKEHTVHSLEHIFPHRFEQKYESNKTQKLEETLRKEKEERDRKKVERKERHREMRSKIKDLEEEYINSVNGRLKLERELEEIKRAAGLVPGPGTPAGRDE